MSQKYIFISRLYSFRIIEPISQIDLAKELGIARQTLAAIENGTQRPTLFTAFRIAQYFKTTIDVMFTFRER